MWLNGLSYLSLLLLCDLADIPASPVYYAPYLMRRRCGRRTTLQGLTCADRLAASTLLQRLSGRECTLMEAILPFRLLYALACDKSVAQSETLSAMFMLLRTTIGTSAYTSAEPSQRWLFSPAGPLAARNEAVHCGLGRRRFESGSDMIKSDDLVHVDDLAEVVKCNARRATFGPRKRK
jgi:hypothetical protein